MNANGNTEDRVGRSGTRTRQGVTGHNVRYVLLAGTVTIIVLFAIVYIAFFT